MNKYLIGASILLFLWATTACTRDQGAQQEAPASEPVQEKMTGKELMDKLRSEALAEDDIRGRLQASVVPLQEEFDKSEPAMEDLKDVQVSVSEDCVLTIENHARGESQIKVDLSKLDPDGFSLIPDRTADEFPGLRIKTMGGAALVEVYQEGELVTRNNELVIMMAQRPNIERIAPVMVQMIRICQGEL